jgi:ribosomal protein S12 methylthiotransferase
MSQRFAKDLPNALPEVDAFIGLDQVAKVAPIIEEIYAKERGADHVPTSFIEGRSTWIPHYDTPRFRLTPKHSQCIKSQKAATTLHVLHHPTDPCGRHRSRTVASMVAEARQLVREGVKEINLISQDTTFFGMDTWEQRPNPRTPVDSSRGTALTTLLRELNAIEGDFWIDCSTRTPRIGATNSSARSRNARRWRATSIFRCSTSATACRSHAA